MSDVTTLHAQARRLILSLREGLEKLEATESGARQGDAATLARDLRAQFKELERTAADLDSVWRMQVIRENTDKRSVWKRKVEQVSEEVYTLRNSLDKFGTREQRRQAERADREELLSRAEAGRKTKQEMDDDEQAKASVGRSKRALEEIYESGKNILVNMAGNRETLKRAQRNALDIINSVGLGETLLKLIERRQKMDIWITYGGMLLVLVIVIVLLWWMWS